MVVLMMVEVTVCAGLVGVSVHQHGYTPQAGHCDLCPALHCQHVCRSVCIAMIAFRLSLDSEHNQIISISISIGQCFRVGKVRSHQTMTAILELR